MCAFQRELRLSLLEESAGLLRKLEARLESLPEPVSPPGTLDLEICVWSDLSPLYFPEKAAALPGALAAALAGTRTRLNGPGAGNFAGLMLVPASALGGPIVEGSAH